MVDFIGNILRMLCHWYYMVLAMFVVWMCSLIRQTIKIKQKENEKQKHVSKKIINWKSQCGEIWIGTECEANIGERWQIKTKQKNFNSKIDYNCQWEKIILKSYTLIRCNYKNCRLWTIQTETEA